MRKEIDTPGPRTYIDSLRALRKPGALRVERTFALVTSTRTYELETPDASPCTRACPVGINAKGYVTAIAEGRFDQALAIVRDNNPLPSICGRICSRPCETECTRKDFGGAIAIRALKRFVADFEQLQSPPLPKPLEPLYSEKVAVVGSGPAGLTAAHDLARHGYSVTVFEKENTPGGLLMSAIPDFKLPGSAVEYDIDMIARLGVDIKADSPVESPTQLLSQGFAAVVVCTGAGAPGGPEDDDGHVDYIKFMRRSKAGAEMPEGQGLAVLGCSQEAVDTARAAVRAEYDTVHLVFPRTRAEFPCQPEDLDLAEQDGVKLMELTQVTSIRTGRIECAKVTSTQTPFAGRRDSVATEDSGFSLAADLAVRVEPRKVDLSIFASEDGFVHTRWGFLAVDPVTLSTGVEGVFAAGDVVTGPKNVIEAMAAGRRASASVHCYLRDRPAPAQSEPEFPFILQPEDIEAVEQVKPGLSEWRKDEDPKAETEQCYQEKDAVAEAARCLRCGPCIECAVCSPDCHKCSLIISFEEEYTRTAACVPAIQKLVEDEAEHSLEVTEVHPPQVVSRRSCPAFTEEAYCSTDTALCSGCGVCQETCRYSAALVEFREGRFVARIERKLCRACGACAAACPSGAITQGCFTEEYFDDMIAEVLKA